MGNHSTRIADQEKFVHQNYDKYKKSLPSCNRYQVQGKLRQLYHGRDNNDSYISSHVWKKTKASIR